MKYLIMLLFSVNSLIFSQSEILNGKVIDSETNQVLVGVNVTLVNSNNGTATNINGEFNLYGDFAQTDILKFSFLGYNDYEISVSELLKSNKNILLTQKTLKLNETIVVEGIRAKEGITPVAFTDISADEIKDRNFGQEIPLFLTEVPGVYSYSNTGSGLGYSEVKIRGFDPTRIAVTVNNVPLNDPEDHTTYFYDIPDLSSNVQDIQVQRGVGNSLYGGAAIGGSISILTETSSVDPKISLISGFGSYNTRRLNLSFNSGMVDQNYSFYGRFSKVNSDGYRDDAWVKSWSYFLSASRYDDNMITTFNAFGGPVIAFAAWYGIDKETLETDRTSNYYSPKNQNGHKFSGDDFLQSHYQLINNWQISKTINIQNTLFHVKGDGFYETYKFDRDFSEYNLEEIILPDGSVINETDLVRQKWVHKSQWGWLPRLTIDHGSGSLIIGGEVSLYKAKHNGEIKWAQTLPANVKSGHDYYRYDTDKKSFTFYLHESYNISEKLNAMADLQFQHHTYNFVQDRIGAYKDKGYKYELTYNFLTPRIGLNYKVSNDLNVFGNFSIAKREPKDRDIYDADEPEAYPAFRRNGNNIDFDDPLLDPETLYDFELGFGYNYYPFELKLNGYWMDFSNEIVPTGAVDDEGNVIHGNADRSVHRGLEIALGVRTNIGLTFTGNMSISDNIFLEYIEPIAEYDADWNKTIIYKDRKNNPIAGFPNLIANARINYRYKNLLSSLHLQSVGKQYLDNSKNEEFTIESYFVLNYSIKYNLENILGLQSLYVDFKVNNLLDEEYETFGAVDWGVAYYVPAADRNYFITLGLEL